MHVCAICLLGCTLTCDVCMCMGFVHMVVQLCRQLPDMATHRVFRCAICVWCCTCVYVLAVTCCSSCVGICVYVSTGVCVCLCVCMCMCVCMCACVFVCHVPRGVFSITQLHSHANYIAPFLSAQLISSSYHSAQSLL